MKRPRRRYNQHIHPTTRDLAIFAYIAQLGVANATQIHRLFWPQAKLQTCKDRLALLTQGGFLHTTTTDARGEPEEIFWIERKAGLLFPEEERRAQTRGLPASAELSHLLRTRDILDRLQATDRLVAFRTEHQLKADKVRAMRGEGTLQIADGELTVRSSATATRTGAPSYTSAGGDERVGEQTFFLEVDGAYYGKRLEQKVRDLSRAQRGVLWVVYSRRRLATISRLSAPYRHIRVILNTAL